MGWRSELDIVNSEPKNFSRGRSYRDAYLPSSPSCRVSSNRLLDCLQQFVPGASPHNNCDRPSCDHNSETESGLENMEHSNACLRGYAGTRETADAWTVIIVIYVVTGLPTVYYHNFRPRKGSAAHSGTSPRNCSGFCQHRPRFFLSAESELTTLSTLRRI